MRQKLITLDPYSWELAQRKKNFSEWVRSQLRLELAGESIGELSAHNESLEKQIAYWIDIVEKQTREMKNGRGELK
tara:strand:- start:332 stop:559 length:228 start_codon:yes stop_codon:yes gene_type:complete